MIMDLHNLLIRSRMTLRELILTINTALMQSSTWTAFCARPTILLPSLRSLEISSTPYILEELLVKLDCPWLENAHFHTPDGFESHRIHLMTLCDLPSLKHLYLDRISNRQHQILDRMNDQGILDRLERLTIQLESAGVEQQFGIKERYWNTQPSWLEVYGSTSLDFIRTMKFVSMLNTTRLFLEVDQFANRNYLLVGPPTVLEVPNLRHLSLEGNDLTYMSHLIRSLSVSRLGTLEISGTSDQPLKLYPILRERISHGWGYAFSELKLRFTDVHHLVMEWPPTTHSIFRSFSILCPSLSTLSLKQPMYTSHTIKPDDYFSLAEIDPSFVSEVDGMYMAVFPYVTQLTIDYEGTTSRDEFYSLAKKFESDLPLVNENRLKAGWKALESVTLKLRTPHEIPGHEERHLLSGPLLQVEIVGEPLTKFYEPPFPRNCRCSYHQNVSDY
jgi:hypothetical protein